MGNADGELCAAASLSGLAQRRDISYPPTRPKRHDDESLPYESVEGPEPWYPNELQREVEGEVTAIMRVAPSGEVLSAAVRSSRPYGAFDESVLAAAKRTRVIWKTPGPSAPVCTERTYQFCFDGPVRVPFWQCRRLKQQ